MRNRGKRPSSGEIPEKMYLNPRVLNPYSIQNRESSILFTVENSWLKFSFSTLTQNASVDLVDLSETGFCPSLFMGMKKASRHKRFYDNRWKVGTTREEHQYCEGAIPIQHQTSSATTKSRRNGTVVVKEIYVQQRTDWRRRMVALTRSRLPNPQPKCSPVPSSESSATEEHRSNIHERDRRKKPWSSSRKVRRRRVSVWICGISRYLRVHRGDSRRSANQGTLQSGLVKSW